MSQIQQLPDSDADSIDIDNVSNNSIIIHEDTEQTSIGRSLRTATDTLYELCEECVPLPFKPCTLEDLEADIIDCACSESKSLFFVVQALHEHFSRSKGYTAKTVSDIKKSLIGRIQARQLSKQRYDEVIEIISNFFK